MELKDSDKLEKLIRLANNNPNENEANLAARKVCKMLENVRFNFKEKKEAPRTSPTGAARSAAEFWRRKEEEARQAKAEAERFNKEREREERERRSWHVRFDEGMNVNFDDLIGKKVNYSRVNEDPLYRGRSRHYNPSEKKKLKCTKCGEEKETGFVGPPQVYVCTPCQWKGEEFK